MATYEELASITEDSNWGPFIEKVKVAAAIKANTIINSVTPTTVALDWAKSVLKNPKATADELAWYAIAENNTATIVQILGATDSAIQTNINSAVDVLYP